MKSFHFSTFILLTFLVFNISANQSSDKINMYNIPEKIRQLPQTGKKHNITTLFTAFSQIFSNHLDLKSLNKTSDALVSFVPYRHLIEDKNYSLGSMAERLLSRQKVLDHKKYLTTLSKISSAFINSSSKEIDAYPESIKIAYTILKNFNEIEYIGSEQLKILNNETLFGSQKVSSNDNKILLERGIGYILTGNPKKAIYILTNTKFADNESQCLATIYTAEALRNLGDLKQSGQTLASIGQKKLVPECKSKLLIQNFNLAIVSGDFNSAQKYANESNFQKIILQAAVYRHLNKKKEAISKSTTILALLNTNKINPLSLYPIARSLLINSIHFKDIDLYAKSLKILTKAETYRLNPTRDHSFVQLLKKIGSQMATKQKLPSSEINSLLNSIARENGANSYYLSLAKQYSEKI